MNEISADAFRLDELEMRVAHQDAAIAELNEVITAQWDKLASMDRALARLREEFQNASSAREAPEPPPPHY